MNSRASFLLYTLLLVLLPGLSRATIWEVGHGQPYDKLRPVLALAQAGDTLRVYQGHYAEGNLLIEKKLTLLGVGYPVIDGDNEDEVITIRAAEVEISGFIIQNGGRSNTIDKAGIKVLAADCVLLQDNKVRNCNFGIYLSNANYCTVRRCQVTGTPSIEQNTGNGIHLWKCVAADVEYNHIAGHRDGIYFEFVTDSRICGNLSEKNLRYGLHFMFSHHDNYVGNRFRNNGAGVAVMYSRQVDMSANWFEDNWGAAAYGILLKGISDSRITTNVFSRNTAAIYMEGASRMEIENNDFVQNGWAIRVQASCDDNAIAGNNFYGNSFDVSTNGQLVLNTFNGNYWDKHEGYDLDKNGIGDVAYRPVSLYAIVVEQMPYGLMLMRSFMVYLMDKAEKLFPSLTPEKLKDELPLMRPIPR